MRIIAGKYRSRRLQGAGTLRLRPTSDRLRETLFNVLGSTLEESYFVDVYAGTGAVGIEAISRGARETIFVESHRAAVRLVKENLKALEISSGAELIEADAIRGLEKLAARHMTADFIFFDPPYEEEDAYLRVLEFLDASHLVGPYSLAIAEHRRQTELPERLTSLERTRLLEQGDAALSFYRRAAAA